MKVSERNSIRTNSSHSEIWFWTIRNHSELMRQTFRILFNENRSKINSTWSDLFPFNPYHQYEWIRTKFLIRVNTNQSELGLIWSELSIRMNSRSELFRLKTWFGYNRIDASDWSGINRIKSDWCLTDFHQTRYKTFFGLVRKQISEWLGFVRIEFLSETFFSSSSKFESRLWSMTVNNFFSLQWKVKFHSSWIFYFWLGEILKLHSKEFRESIT